MTSWRIWNRCDKRLRALAGSLGPASIVGSAFAVRSGFSRTNDEPSPVRGRTSIVSVPSTANGVGSRDPVGSGGGS